MLLAFEGSKHVEIINFLSAENVGAIVEVKTKQTCEFILDHFNDRVMQRFITSEGSKVYFVDEDERLLPSGIHGQFVVISCHVLLDSLPTIEGSYSCLIVSRSLFKRCFFQFLLLLRHWSSP
jgi:hypothetical protein